MIDFLGVGPDRTGTSTLWRILQNHPEVSFPVREWHLKYPTDKIEKNLKGIYWYDWKNFDPADKEIYESHWDNVGVRGEICATYSKFADRIFSVYPDIKIILTWRDPVKRFVSHLSLLKSQVFERKFSTYILSHVADPFNQDPMTSEKIEEFIGKYTADTFVDAVENYFLHGEDNIFLDSILPIGHPDQLLEWKSKTKNLLVLPSDTLYHDQAQAVDIVTSFLGVSNFTVPDTLHFNKRPKIELSEQVLEKVNLFYSLPLTYGK